MEGLGDSRAGFLLYERRHENGMHPFRAHGAVLAGGQVLCQYQSERPVARARLRWTGGELPVAAVAPGLLGVANRGLLALAARRGTGFFTGHLRADPLTRGRPVPANTSPYDYFPGPHRAPGAGQPGGPMLPVQVPSLSDPVAREVADLTLLVQDADLQVGGPWRLTVDVPRERPAALEVAQPAGDADIRLEEV